MIVLSLIGVLLAISVSSFRGAMAREQTDGTARAMVREIEAGRQAALTRRETVRLVVTSTGYSVTTIGGTILRRVALPEDITATTTCPAGVCAFGRRGIPLAAGTITLTSVLTGRTFAVTIATGTGAVSQSEL